MYFVYLLECADGSIYTGITTDVERRLREHQNKKGGSYTRSHGAKRIVYQERHRTRGQALRREAEIKSWPRGRKLALIMMDGERNQPAPSAAPPTGSSPLS